MKFTKGILLATAILMMVFALAACHVQFEATVYFYVDNVVYDIVETTGAAPLSMPSNPSKEGYTFEGWFWDKGVWSMPVTVNSFLDTPVSESFSVYAYFKPLQQAPHIAVTFVVDGVALDTVVTEGDAMVALPSNPSKTGHTFEGWYFDNNVWTQQFLADTLTTSPKTESFSVYAYFKAIPIAVTFIADGNAVNTVLTDGKSAVSLPTQPSKTGFTFEGWFVDNGTWTQPFTANTLIQSPKTQSFSVYAYFKPITIEITYIANEAIFEATQTDGRSAVVLPQNPTKDNHTFEGWFFDLDIWTKPFSAESLVSNPATEDFSVYAWFKPVYTVTFISENVEIGTLKTDGKSAVVLPTNPTKDKFTFEGWFFDKDTWQIPFDANSLVSSPKTQDFSVYALFKPVPVEITFMTDGKIFDLLVTDGKSAIVLPQDVYKGGYDFLGWYLDDGVWANEFLANSLVSNPVTDSFSVYAKFSPFADLYVDKNADEQGNVFNTITAALAAANDGDVIFVSAGVYAEVLMLDRPITILGNNHDKKGYDSRREETVITIDTDIGDNIYQYLSAVNNSIITIYSNDIVLKGLTIDGNNPDIENIWTQQRHDTLFGTGEITAGSSKYYSAEYLKDFFGKDVGIDAAVGVFFDQSIKDKTVIIENNIIQNFWQFGIESYDTSVDSVYAGNMLREILPLTTHYKGGYWGSYGVGINFSNGSNGTVTDNMLFDMIDAIQVQSHTSYEITVSENQIFNCNSGIWVNSISVTPVVINVTSNRIIFGEGKAYFRPQNNYGMGLTSINNLGKPTPTGSITFTGNYVENYTFGLATAYVYQGGNVSVISTEFVNISQACIGFLDVVYGYTLNQDIYLTLQDNNYNDNQWLFISNAKIAHITENGVTTEYTKD